MPSRALALLTALLLAVPSAHAEDVALHVARVAQPGAAPLTQATLILRDGKVAELAHEADEEGAQRLSAPDAWAVPGFCDPLTGLGALNDRDELGDPLAGELLWLVDPSHPDFSAALRSGITSCLLSPGDQTLIGGAGLVLRGDGTRFAGAPRVAKLTLAPSAWEGRTTPPTSRTGALAALRGRLRQAHETRDATAWGDFARGDVLGVVRVAADDDIRQLRALAEPYGLRLAFALDASFGAGDLDDVEVGDHTLILGPYDLETPTRSLRLAGELARRGISIAFTGGAPQRDPTSLRLTAALAVRHGLDADVALDAITRVPARLLGLSGRTGGLQLGEEADVVLFDGPPLKLSSRVLAVFLGGRLVHAARPLPWKEDS
jgi:hypothetical protein